MRYRVVHDTRYAYDGEVSSSYGLAHLLPRSLAGQRVLEAGVSVTPDPGDVRERVDYFGNRLTYFGLLRGHTSLAVTATSVVEVDARGIDGRLVVDQPWERVRDLLRQPLAEEADAAERLAAVEFRLGSPQAPISPAAAAYARPSFRPGRGLLEAVSDLSARIHADFAFRPGATSVGTPVQEVLARRAGVCQDFAHLTVAALRSHGLACRYVSGYLETDPPPGQPKLQGADVSHAWAAFWLPGVGWVDIDPTNDQLVNDRYITVAWGRDYGDVAPLKGVIFTDADTTSLKVSVDVRQLPDEQPVSRGWPAAPGAPPG